MNLSISNIAWSVENDQEMYDFLNKHNFNGLEIAPTRIFGSSPYNHLIEAKDFAVRLKKDYELTISSMQSIWYGITESIFVSDTDRQILINYTKEAINFACAVNCKNLVFGCPKNRNIPVGMNADVFLPIVHNFFNTIGNYAAEHDVFIAIEPNPPIYNTNFINTTEEAFELCKAIKNHGIKVNVDLGTMIYNNEDVKILSKNINLINHVHISEPHLVPIEKRELHKEIITELCSAGYEKFISIEMGNKNNIEIVKETILYVKELCYDV